MPVLIFETVLPSPADPDPPPFTKIVHLPKIDKMASTSFSLLTSLSNFLFPGDSTRFFGKVGGFFFLLLIFSPKGNFPIFILMRIMMTSSQPGGGGLHPLIRLHRDCTL